MEVIFIIISYCIVWFQAFKALAMFER